jgi:glycosyltransferase involved in cell wall biosynthesis
MNNYFIKEGYTSNLKPDYYQDVPQNIEYQHHVYQLSAYLAKRSGATYVIDLGSGNGNKLVKYFGEFNIITVDFGDNSSYVNDKFEHIQFNFDNGLPNIDKEILKNAVVIASDVIEHLINPNNFTSALSDWSKLAKYVVISTPDRDIARGINDMGHPANLAHVREWNLSEFNQYLNYFNFGMFLIGHTENTDFHKQKATILAVAGREVNYVCNDKLLNVLAIMNCYNEKDIIVESINHILNQGLDVCVIDNYSNDGTYELVADIFANNPRVVLRQSKDYGNNYEWQKLLEGTEGISHEFSQKYIWFMHYDADEIRYSPIKDITLQQMITFVDSLGYNSIDMTVIDFRFTRNVNVQQNYENNLLSFEFGRRAGHFCQVKCWKYAKDLSLAPSGGHDAQFADRKVYPIKFLMKHYPLRNIEQAKNKIFIDRANRIQKEKLEKGWHAHYDNFIVNNENIVFNEHQLVRWHKNIFDYEYLVERISGIGIL